MIFVSILAACILGVALILQIVALVTRGWYRGNFELAPGLGSTMEAGLFEYCFNPIDIPLLGSLEKCDTFGGVQMGAFFNIPGLGAISNFGDWGQATQVLEIIGAILLFIALIIAILCSTNHYCWEDPPKPGLLPMLTGVTASFAVISMVAGQIIWGFNIDDHFDKIVESFSSMGASSKIDKYFEYSFAISIVAAILTFIVAILAFICLCYRRTRSPLVQRRRYIRQASSDEPRRYFREDSIEPPRREYREEIIEPPHRHYREEIIEPPRRHYREEVIEPPRRHYKEENIKRWRSRDHGPVYNEDRYGKRRSGSDSASESRDWSETPYNPHFYHPQPQQHPFYYLAYPQIAPAAVPIPQQPHMPIPQQPQVLIPQQPQVPIPQQLHVPIPHQPQHHYHQLSGRKQHQHQHQHQLGPQQLQVPHGPVMYGAVNNGPVMGAMMYSPFNYQFM